jgi:hypothetical protein
MQIMMALVWEGEIDCPSRCVVGRHAVCSVILHQAQGALVERWFLLNALQPNTTVNTLRINET